jgi:hypothetical protein
VLNFWVLSNFCLFIFLRSNTHFLNILFILILNQQGVKKIYRSIFLKGKFEVIISYEMLFVFEELF